MHSVSKVLGGPRIWIKRDDLTGLAFGGSKVRALEFALADAVNKGADTVVTMGPPQSNHARLTAAAARKIGLNVVLIIATQAAPKKYEGNLLLDRILGADIRFAKWTEHSNAVEQVIRELNDKGHTPYILPFGGSSPIGTVGYVKAAIELQNQAKDMGIEIDHIIHATASGGLQTGLLVGNIMLNKRTKVTGVTTIMNSSKLIALKNLSLARDVCEILNIEVLLKPDDLCLLDYFRGQGTDVEMDEKRVMNAIKFVANAEGIILDPEYTGKAMEVLIEMVKQNKFHRRDNIVFMHTGGTPALFLHSRTYRRLLPAGLIRLYRKCRSRYSLVRWA